jgi:hypothetical protein
MRPTFSRKLEDVITTKILEATKDVRPKIG